MLDLLFLKFFVMLVYLLFVVALVLLWWGLSDGWNNW